MTPKQALGAYLTEEQRHRSNTAIRMANEGRVAQHDENNYDRLYFLDDYGRRIYYDGGEASPAPGEYCVDCGVPKEGLTPDPQYEDEMVCPECLAAVLKKRAAERPSPANDGHEEAELTYADRLRAALIYGDDVKKLEPPEPMVEGVLDYDTLALVFGPSGCTKTFVTLDLALSVATGTWWHGHKVEAGDVLYVVAEGLGGIGARVQAWQTKRQVHTCTEISWLPMAVNLMDANKVDALVEIVRLHHFALVVLDTLARCLTGADENSARDIGVAVEAAERIRRASGACVVLVHHSGKDQASGARGSSALRGAVATEIEVSHADGVTTLKQTKQREHAPAEPVRLSLVPVGDSCAFEPYRGEGGLTKEAIELLAELAAIVTDDDGVSGSVWKASSGVADRSFYRRQKYLVSEGYCHKGGTKGRPLYTVSDLGREVLGQ